MDRIIEVKVFGNHLTKDSKNAGTRGEANITKLRITFDEGWDKFEKKVVFWDAYGENAVRIILTENLYENIEESTRIYLVPIPAEAMARAGMMSFEVIGSLNDIKQASITGELEVQDSKMILDPIPHTPDDISQLQTQFEDTVAKLQETIKAKQAIENMGVSAEELSTGQEAFVEKSINDDVVHLHFGLPAGKEGYTPQAGIDYWTDEEKKAISDFVSAKVGETEDAVEIIRAIQDALINGEPIAVIFKEFAKVDLSNVSDEDLKAKIQGIVGLFDGIVVTPEHHTHTASEIGAAPIDHTHTPEEIGASPVGHTHTASEVGASAVGHKHSASDIDSGTLNSARLPTIPITKGGTGATDIVTARANLGIKSEDWSFTLENGSTVTKKVLVL